MSKVVYKLILTAFFSVILFLIFNMLEFELLNEGMNQNIQSIIFSICAGTAIFYPKLRNKLLYVSFTPLFLMIMFYLLGDIKLANSIGSLGFGILTIAIMSYVPTILKNGYIEKI